MRDLILKPYLAPILGCKSWRQGILHFMSSNTFTSANPTLCGVLPIVPGLLLQYQRQIDFNPPCPLLMHFYPPAVNNFISHSWALMSPLHAVGGGGRGGGRGGGSGGRGAGKSSGRGAPPSTSKKAARPRPPWCLQKIQSPLMRWRSHRRPAALMGENWRHPLTLRRSKSRRCRWKRKIR